MYCLKLSQNQHKKGNIKMNILKLAPNTYVKHYYPYYPSISGSYDYLPESLKIKNIAYCDTPGKEKVILVFKDGSKVIKKMCAGDTFDLNIGVALAFMEKVYGSKTQYHKMIQKKLPKK